MPFLLANNANLEERLPLYIRCAGSHEQQEVERIRCGYALHQLFLTRRGQGTFRVRGGREYRVGAGMALLMPANIGHHYRPDSPADAWTLGFIAFGGSAADGLLSQLGVDKLPARGTASSRYREQPIAFHTPNFEDLWLRLEAIWHRIQQGSEQAYDASRRLYDLLLALIEGQFPSASQPGKTAPPGSPHTALQIAVQWIHDHLTERLLVPNVAKAAGYSVQHFHRLFVASYGVTPQQYILQLRMSRALQLLGDYPGMTVEQVAEQLGMDVSYFIRMFKRTYGTTPKRYAMANG
ncbi:AraC family transcriptional regulator [Paenibacillus sp. 598K]|nr:AraC family transcriptional regulator [Paenibacillus sp. 598K]